MKKIVIALAVLTLMALCLPTFLSAQRADRGVITGIVTDQSGSAVPGATVKVRNEGTGVENVLTSNEAGAYTTPLLVLGSYSISVDHQGFKTTVIPGVQVIGAETIRRDVAMAVGAVTESVEVTAGAETINTTTPDVSHTVDNKYYQDLPVITAADVRLAESLLQIQPGYLPMKPNGDPMFRGSQFNSRINGGQTMATENFFDGAAFGYASGHQQSHESTPPFDAIQETKVITTTYSAQYGHTSGGFIEYTSKSGTNSVHGSVYEYFANDALNARGFFDSDCDTTTGQCTPRKKSPLKNNGFGFTLGGPVVIPKVYNGKNKTFFFTNIDWTRLRGGVLPGFGNTTPIDAFRGCITDPVNGVCDFSALGPSQVLYNPFSSGNGATGRDPFFCDSAGNPVTPNANGTQPQAGNTQCNKIPTQLVSTAASRIAGLMVSPDRVAPGDGVGFNVAGNPAGDQTWLLNARNLEFRVDHNFTPNFRMTETFYWNHRPSIRNCGEVGGCTVSHDGETSPQLNTNYYGNGFYQRIVTHHAHTQFEWIIRNNLSNHTTIAWDRWFMGGASLSAGAGWPKILWTGTPGETLQPQGVGGLVAQDAGPPQIDFSGDLSLSGRTAEYNTLGTYGWGKFGFEAINRWQFSDDLTWVKNKHTIKVGGEYRWHQINHSGWATGAEAGQFRFDTSGTSALNGGAPVQGTGEAFASMLLGQVFSTTQTLPFHPQFYEGYFSPWINDEFKATNRLTLTFGLRFDYQRARTESQNRYTTFDPNTANPGAGGLPGALIYAGKCTGCSGRDTFEDPKHNAWGPRLGFAFRVNDKTAIRGGYGMYYSGIAFSQFQGDPVMGYQSNPTVNNVSNGQFPALPNAVNCNPAQASGCNTLSGNFLSGFDYGFPGTNIACPGPGATCIQNPPFIDPAFANGQSPLAVPKNGLTLPRYQNWSLTFEREVVRNMRLDVSYIANRGTRLPATWQAMGLAANMNDPSIISQYGAVSPSGIGLLGLPITDPAVVGAGITSPYAGFAGTAAQALRQYPQYQNIIWRGVPLGSSMYNALEVVLEQRFSHGLQFRVGYTYSRLNNDGSETGQSGDGRNARIQNPACPHSCEWGLSDDDTPHVLLFGYTWEIPVAQHSTGAMATLLKGWNISGVQRYESGRPLNITMANVVFDPTTNSTVGLGNILFNPQKRPDRAKGVSARAPVNGSFYNPRDPNQFFFKGSAWSDPGANLFGTAARADGTARGFSTFSEDINLFKTFALKEQLSMRFEAQFGNIFNRTQFCDPSTFWSGGDFGSIGTQCNQPRSIQFGLKISY